MSGLGLVTLDHTVPFQCKSTGPSAVYPAAQELVAERTVTLMSPSMAGLPPGTVTWDQDCPFQCASRPPCACVSDQSPTAQASVVESALTPVSSLMELPGKGTWNQALPFQCHKSV